jgi:hypothetical protein
MGGWSGQQSGTLQSHEMAPSANQFCPRMNFTAQTATVAKAMLSTTASGVYCEEIEHE